MQVYAEIRRITDEKLKFLREAVIKSKKDKRQLELPLEN